MFVCLFVCLCVCHFQSLFRSLMLVLGLVTVWIYFNGSQSAGAKCTCIWNLLSATFGIVSRHRESLVYTYYYYNIVILITLLYYYYNIVKFLDAFWRFWCILLLLVSALCRYTCKYRCVSGSSAVRLFQIFSTTKVGLHRHCVCRSHSPFFLHTTRNCNNLQ